MSRHHPNNTNLLEETLKELSDYGYTPTHVEAVLFTLGNYREKQEFWMTFDEFRELAKGCDYYDGHGSQEVNSGLTLLLPDGRWMSRSEYDGAEGWELNIRPTPEKHLVPASLREHYSEYEWKES